MLFVRLYRKKQLLALKEAGISRYHSNIETAPSYFPHICSTHSFADKAAMLKRVQAVGLRPCCGGIFGLGESCEQRLEMAFALKDLGIDSVPLNILNPIKGTPLEKRPPFAMGNIAHLCGLPLYSAARTNPHGRRQRG